MESFYHFLGPLTTVLLVVLGGIFGYIKLKATVITLGSCRSNQLFCQDKIVNEIKAVEAAFRASAKETRELVIDLHNKQTTRIEETDRKRHDQNNKVQTTFLEVQRQFTETQIRFTGILIEYREGFIEMQKQVSKIEGYIKGLANGDNS